MHGVKQIYTVHKFGGASLADAHCFSAVPALLSGKNEIIVVSAISGVTIALQQLLDMAASKLAYLTELNQLFEKHMTLAKAILPIILFDKVMVEMKHDIEEIHTILQAIYLVENYSKVLQDRILGYGEQWSAKILTYHLSKQSKVLYLDATQFLFVTEKHGVLVVDWPQTKKEFIKYIEHHPFDQCVITGFIARHSNGQRTILGRNGSDFSAAIIAKLIAAKGLYIWKDVDGIYSANPHKVRSAFALETLSYEEALELAYFGAKVLHPKTIAPAIEANIPIYIKNCFKPLAKGTCISGIKTSSPYLVKGITSIDSVAIINIEGTGMLGVSGIAANVFSVMHHSDISVILISQASSEHSICFAINESQADHALQVLTDHFTFELNQKLIVNIKVQKDCAIVAVVGDNMVGAIGIAGKFCDTLGKANVNISAIAQGSSERNISVVLKKTDVNKALRAVHARFFSSNKTISIGLIGPGLVGSTLLQQIHHAKIQLKKNHHIDLCVRGILNSQKMLLSNDAIDCQHWKNQFEEHHLAANFDEFANHILSDDIPHGVIIDCTASQTVADQYIDFINKGLHIITPNKRANSGEITFYNELKCAADKKNRHYLYEATVCAGLPVINTLQDIIKTGDEIISIEGVVSGTLSYIFNSLGKQPFSEIVKKAKQLGYTEPDPRDDLSGKDVARKMVCLAREIGLATKLEDIVVHDLVPDELKTCSLEEFLTRFAEYDHRINSLWENAVQQQAKLVYTGSIKKNGTIAVAIQTVPMHHPFAALQGTDNMLVFRTRRYHEQPLVIQGPGAGAEVTAGGIFADLLRLVAYLSE